MPGRIIAVNAELVLWLRSRIKLDWRGSACVPSLMLWRATCLLASLAASTAQAGSMFLNGVNIDGVVNQVFNNCTVTIDAQGNVFITAAGYAVAVPGAGKPVAQPPPPPAAPAIAPGAAAPAVAPAVAPQAPAAPAPATMTQRYWLVTEKAAPGMTQFDIDLFINSKFVRKFLDDEEHVVIEVTKYLQPGANKLTFIARKNLAGPRRSSSPQHYFRIVVGEGDAGGRNVMINRKLVDYKRTALETKEFTDEFTMVTR